MTEVVLGGKRVKLDPRQLVGAGGEADVYRMSPDRVVKIWKAPDHPDFAGLPQEQEAARKRLASYAEKLRAFPAALPPRVVRPEEPATDRTGGRTLGYAMRFVVGAEVLLRYADRGFRSAGAGADVVRGIFLDLHDTVAGLHRAGVVIGDFNDLNVLVRGTEAHLIDADSFQFGPYPCTVFTARFVDPLGCDRSLPAPLLVRPHRPDSDWYAYAVMLMQCLLFVGPYGGVFRPADPAQRLAQDARPLRRITVFHPGVRYPKPALPPTVLPDDLLQRFHLVFEKDARGEFPRRLVESLAWTRCALCGIEHARAVCPLCAHAVPIPAAPPVAVHGALTVAEVFRTRGRILCAAWQDGTLRWLVHEDGRFVREDGRTVLQGGLDPQLRFALRGEETLIGKGGLLVRVGRNPGRLAVDTFGTTPAFTASARAAYWIDQGRLLRDGRAGPELIGSVLEGQTRFWVGARFGFGFYRAGNLRSAFVFDAERNGLDDSIAAPTLRGTLVDANCAFSDDRCWLFTAVEEGGAIIQRCTVYRRDGSVEATATGNEAWLDPARGRFAAGDALFTALDDGIVRVQPRRGALELTREFPDTEPYVDAGCRILPGPQGMYVIRPDQIRLLRLV